MVEGAKFNWQTTVKGGRALGAGLLKLLHLRAGGMTRGYVGIVFQYAKFVVGLQRRGGWVYVVRYLKACTVLLQQAACGQRIHATQHLGCAVARTNAGLPRVIHPMSRKRIRGGSLWEVALWHSLFGLYRVIGIPGKLNLSSITLGPTVTVGFLQGWVTWLATFFPVFLVRFGYAQARLRWSKYRGRSLMKVSESLVLQGTVLRDFVFTLTAAVYPSNWTGISFDLKPRFRNFVTSGPGSVNPEVTRGVPPRTNLGSFISDANNLRCHQWVGLAFQQWLAGTEGKDGYLSNFFHKANTFWDDVINHPLSDPEAPGYFESEPRSYPVSLADAVRSLHGGLGSPSKARFGFGGGSKIGSLGFKTEAAGKIRVFAMVDALTQMLLGPVHDALFSILRVIPQDGTFDQLKPAKKLVQAGHKSLWSYDLSSATDRFPLSLQQAVMGLIFGPWLAKLWVTILDRDFRVPRTIPSLKKGEKPVKVPKGTPKYVTYGAGQPMGALTSWAAFSLSHHFLVQYAYYKAYGRLEWFEAYALLGDDIVIADKKVSQVYLDLLQEIGVGYGLAKSLISSSGGFEFAKRTFVRGQEVKNIPLLALGSAKADPGLLEDILVRSGVRGYENALRIAARILGYGFKSRSRLPAVLETKSRLQGLAVLLLRPKGPFGTLNFLEWITRSVSGSPLVVSGENLEVLRESVWQRVWDPLFNRYTEIFGLARIWKLKVDDPEEYPWCDADRDVIYTHQATEEYLRFVGEQIFQPYVKETYASLEETRLIVRELKDLSGREGDINDAWAMLTDLAERLDALPSRVLLSERPKIRFSANRRSSTVRLWRAVHDLALKLKDQ